MNTSECIQTRPAAGGSIEPIARLVRATAARVGLWYQRSQQRRALLQLDARQRRDIGVTAEQVLREGRKPFWQE